MIGPVRVNIAAPSGDVVRAVCRTDEALGEVIDIHVHMHVVRGKAELAAWRESDLDGGSGAELDEVSGGKLVSVSNKVPLTEPAKAVGLIVDHGGVLPLTISPVLPI